MLSNLRKIRLCVVAMICSMATPCVGQLVDIITPSYQSTYDLTLQCPRQVLWTVHKNDLSSKVARQSWPFVSDIRHPLATATHEDFINSGFHRGHMCPAADRSATVDMMRSTFTMSNIAPQLPQVNTGTWKRTENFCRSAALLYDSVAVVAVPLFLNRDTLFIGRHRLAVPHAFLKAAWLPRNDSLIGVWMIWNK